VTFRYVRELVDAGDIDSGYNGSGVPGMVGGVRYAFMWACHLERVANAISQEIEGRLSRYQQSRISVTILTLSAIVSTGVYGETERAGDINFE